MNNLKSKRLASGSYQVEYQGQTYQVYASEDNQGTWNVSCEETMSGAQGFKSKRAAVEYIEYSQDGTLGKMKLFYLFSPRG